MKLMKTVLPRTLAAIVVAAMLMLSGLYQPAAANRCDENRWNKANNGYYSGVGYPETTSASYWNFLFSNDPGTHLQLTLSGQYPYARYMAYTLYGLNDDGTRGDPIRYNGDVQHLADVDIKPLNWLHSNPYLDGANRNIGPNRRSYKIYVVQQDSARVGDDNTLVIPANVTKVALFIRIYLPDHDDDPKGGVPLPVIEATSESGEGLECPFELVMDEEIPRNQVVNNQRLDRLHLMLDNFAIETYKPGDYGLFPNGDCPYLTAPLVRPGTVRNPDKIAVLRFKAPAFPDTRNGEGYSPSDEVRYWSLCMGDWVNTTSSKCIADQDVPLDSQNYAHVVVGPDGLIEDKPGWVNLPWGAHLDPIILFRQISPRNGFYGDFNNANLAYDKTDENVRVDEFPEQVYASFKIGAYAPIGTYCTVDDFNTNQCGFAVYSADPEDPVDPPSGDNPGCN